MNSSSEAAEQIVKMSLEGFEVAARITGTGAKDVAALLYAVMKDKRKTAGKTRLTAMLKSGKELKVFSIKREDLISFKDYAKQYGVLYSALIGKNEKINDGVVDIMVRAEDASKIDRIIKRFKLASYDDVSIRSEVEKSISEHKDNSLINPHSGLTVKGPQLKHSSKAQKTSESGTGIDKESVKVKLERAKIESNNLAKRKSEVMHNKTKSKKKGKSR